MASSLRLASHVSVGERTSAKCLRWYRHTKEMPPKPRKSVNGESAIDRARREAAAEVEAASAAAAARYAPVDVAPAPEPPASSGVKRKVPHKSAAADADAPTRPIPPSSRKKPRRDVEVEAAALARCAAQRASALFAPVVLSPRD